ncbi:Glu-tRNA(Gln) amidotransferase subunit GatE [Candidatus Woesearchaeota archaeon]|nr:Glu-tRNA(Gln) amidotransferase subunit GatE [Candidatus Woesearchaeota archaeon]
MVDIDYGKLGFKCGLEIHQQLDTHNLFCNCPSIVHDENPTVEVHRKLKAVVGETGNIDIAAAAEQEKDKRMNYQGCEKSYCLVELDEEPPHSINNEAVEIALQVSKMLNCDIVDEIQIMRKTVIDGSNVSGFQRTALIGIDGHIETSRGNVKIETLCLEEEAAKKAGTDKDSTSYRLDRLGVCLLEIATDASIQDAEHAKECAEILGMMLRSTGKAKRGIGTIRQDVNVSIKGGARVEIKGFQDLKSIPKVIDYEIGRQLKEIKKGKKLTKEVRKAEPDMTTSFLRPMPGGARMYPETDVLPLEINEGMLKAIKVPELISEKKKDLEDKYGLDQGFVNDIIKKGFDFDALVKKYKKLDAKFIASILVQMPKELKRKSSLDVDSLSEADFEEILTYAEKVPKNVVPELIEKKVLGEKISVGDFKGVDDSEIDAFVEKIVKDKPGLNMGGYMGLVMKQFAGKVDGKKASEILKKYI